MTAELSADDQERIRQALERPYSVLVGDQVLVFPDYGTYGPICVAASGRRGQRCRGPVDAGSAGFREIFLPGRDAYIEPAVSSVPDRCYWQQRCPEHVDADIPDVVDLEWEDFDPDRHEAVVKPLGPVWTPEGVRPDPRESRFYREPYLTPAYETPRSGDSEPATPSKDPGPTALYSYYDAVGTALYIGISGSLRARERSHLRGSSWMDFVASSTVDRFSTRAEALDAERAAIKAERPLFNTVHNEGCETSQRLVAYLVIHDRLDLLTPAVSRG
jgi:hypothetical protein